MNEEQVIDELVDYCHRRAEESGVAGGYYEKIAEQLNATVSNDNPFIPNNW